MFCAGLAAAQDWFTYDLCHADPKFDLTAFDTLDIKRVQADAAKITNGTGRFWQITAPNGAASYMWGTYHSNRPQYLRLPEPVVAQIMRSQTVALEYDPVLRSRAAVTELLTQYDVSLPGSETNPFVTNKLDQILKPNIANAIDARLTAIGWGQGSYLYIRPEILAEVVLGDPCNDFAQNVLQIQDSFIQMLGIMAGADILGLEAEDAFKQKLGDPKNRALTFDMLSLYGMTLTPGLTQAQAQTWAAISLEGRVGLGRALESALVRKEFGDARGAEILARADGFLLAERNMTFADSAETALHQGGLFIAIGSWHLPGPDGMVDLLRRRGYVVTRIPLPREAAE